MDKFREFLSNIGSEWKTGISIALAMILVFSLGNIAGSLTNINATPVDEAGAQVEESVVDTQASTDAPTTQAPTTQVPTTQAPAQIVTTQVPATQAPVADSQSTDAVTAAPETQTPSTGAPATTAEIVALFNESANKIKTNATKATRNYQNLEIKEIQVPSALQALADSLTEKFLKPDMTPQEWTGADIAEKYPVGGTDFVSKLTEADVASATCTDNGTEYEIVINLNSHKDPVYRSGEGVNSVFWVINKDDIANNVPGLQESEVFYHDCQVIAKIDKATGNMTYAKYLFHFDFDLLVKLVVSLDVFATILVDEEYVIEY